VVAARESTDQRTEVPQHQHGLRLCARGEHVHRLQEDPAKENGLRQTALLHKTFDHKFSEKVKPLPDEQTRETSQDLSRWEHLPCHLQL